MQVSAQNWLESPINLVLMKVDLIHKPDCGNVVPDALNRREELPSNKNHSYPNLVTNVCGQNKFVMQDLQCCRAPFHEECPKHHGHKGNPGVTPGTCGAIGERAQVILVWVRAPGIGNASHPRRLGVHKGKAMSYA